jgi:hypothetical protein
MEPFSALSLNEHVSQRPEELIAWRHDGLGLMNVAWLN